MNDTALNRDTVREEVHRRGGGGARRARRAETGEAWIRKRRSIADGDFLCRISSLVGASYPGSTRCDMGRRAEDGSQGGRFVLLLLLLFIAYPAPIGGLGDSEREGEECMAWAKEGFLDETPPRLAAMLACLRGRGRGAWRRRGDVARRLGLYDEAIHNYM